jgi:hypothetical protein
MTCDAMRPSVRAVLKNPARAGVAVTGLGCVIGSALVGGTPTTVPILLSAGGILLLVGFAWSTVSAVELNAPLVKLAVTTANRKEAIEGFCLSQRSDLETCAAEICNDPDVALTSLEAAVAAAAGNWAGPINYKLRLFLLCVIVRTAMHEAAYHGVGADNVQWAGTPTSSHPAAAWFDLSLEHRALLVLSAREGLAASVVGQILDMSAADVELGIADAQIHLTRAG